MSYDTTDFAIKAVNPSNAILIDDQQMPGVYVRYAPNTCKDLVEGFEDSSVHPAFLMNGKQLQDLYIGKYPGVSHSDRIYSLPATVATTSITMEQYITRCRNKGTGHHAITAAEWAYLALLAKKNKTQPKGNNQWGRDISETATVALRGNTDERSDAGAHKGQTAQVLTGTGPDTWYDNGNPSGVWGLNGNIWEWTPGLRLVFGEIQVIPYNNAADPACDFGASSPAWKAINADATNWDNLFITPTGSNGRTANSVKMDWLTDHWDLSKTIITDQDESKMCAFKSVTVNESVKDFARHYLETMALAPRKSDTDYVGNVWANNKQAERCAFRGAGWSNGSSAGVFALNLNNPRSGSWVDHGGRPAFVQVPST